jgi:heme/copper-type cytochrome/quinol oxidase subunit 2
VNPYLALVCGLLVAGGVHTVKSAAIRPAVTAATGGTANIPVSIAEDVVSTVLSILSIVIPILVGVFLVIMVALIIWFFWRRARRRSQAVS